MTIAIEFPADRIERGVITADPSKVLRFRALIDLSAGTCRIVGDDDVSYEGDRPQHGTDPYGLSGEPAGGAL